MAKLTEDQKASNKEASSLRQAAYHARLKEYRASEDADKLVVASSPQQELLNSVNDKFNRVMQRRDEFLSVIDEQIAHLQVKRKRAAEYYSGIFNDEVGPERDKAVYSRNGLVRELRDKTDKLFGDISNSSGSSLNWRAPEGYIARYAAENADLLAKKKAACERKAVKVSDHKEIAGDDETPSLKGCQQLNNL